MRNYRIPIVGTRYRDEREQEFFSQLQSEPSLANLFFEPEPDNQFDPLAIKVCCATVGTPRIFAHLGYIPKNMTHILHRAFQLNHIIEKELIKNSTVMNITIREASAEMLDFNPKGDEI